MSNLSLLLFITSFSQFVFAQQYSDVTNTHLPASATTINTMDVESADLDGDGDLDLVLAAEFQPNLILFNDGNGVFTIDTSKVFPVTQVYSNPNIQGEDSEDIAITDFDDDGDLDILFVTEDTNNHEFLLNDGTGKFTLAAYQFPRTIPANALLVMQINSDNFPDVIIGNNGQNQLYINNGNGSFTDETSTRFPTNTDGTQDLKAADIDGDGDLDIIEGIESGGNNLYINNNGTFTEESSRLSFGANNIETRKVTIGDLDNDNDLDIFYSNVGWTAGTSPINRILLNDGTGNFTDETTGRLPIKFETTVDAVFLDLNGDNLLDIVTTEFQAQSSHHVYLNNPNNVGHFTESTTNLPNINYPNGISLHLGDFNGDGQEDIYFGNFQSTDKLLLSTVISKTTAVKQALDITIFPNPVTNKLTIRNNDYSQKITFFQIHNATGKLILEMPFDTNNAQTQIRTTDFINGTYVVTLLLDSGEFYSRTIVVNNE